MASVFVAGSTGYIGFEVARAFRGQGYVVHGLVRSAAKARTLRAAEIIPVEGTMTALAPLTEHLRGAAVVVDATGDFNEQAKFFELVKGLSSVTTPKTYIYTSGILVHGDTDKLPGRVASEASPLAPAGFLKGRVKFEEAVLGANGTHGLTTVVLRPGFVYGGAGGWAAPMLFDAKVLNFGVNKHVRWNWVHVTDVAAAFVAAVRKGRAAGGDVFDIVTNDTPTCEQIWSACKRLAGVVESTMQYDPIAGNVIAGSSVLKYEPIAGNFISEHANASSISDGRKAEQVLDWHPAHVNFLAELPTYYQSFMAAQQGASSSH